MEDLDLCRIVRFVADSVIMANSDNYIRTLRERLTTATDEVARKMTRIHGRQVSVTTIRSHLQYLEWVYMPGDPSKLT